MSDFVKAGSWFEKKYKVKSDARYPTFKKALDLFLENKGKIICETGCVRLENDFGAGMSTVMFAEFLEREVSEGYLSTVDISETNINTCKQITEKWKDIIEYVVQDSIQFLTEFPFKIDLLYLDSMDYPLTPEEGNPILCQRHQLNEYLAAQHKMAENSVILLDDASLPFGGKCRLTKEQLVLDGYKLILEGQQSLWQKKNPGI